MTIVCTPINIPFFNKVKTNLLLRSCEKKLHTLPYDSFELSPEAKLQRQANSIYSRTRKFTINDYNALSKLEKSVLRETSKKVSDVAQTSLKIGIKVKEHLDKRYGEGKYVFCSIGTSPSQIARVLEFMGVETKYIPISGLRKLTDEDEYKKYSDKFPKYQEFLNEQGLSSEQVKNSGKQYNFYDYIFTGRSLRFFEKMMRETFGLDLPNISFHSVDFLCYSACAKDIDPPKYVVDFVEDNMTLSMAAEFGGIPHLELENIDKIDECIFYENVVSKKFNFILIDELSKKGLLKNNPANKNSL